MKVKEFFEMFGASISMQRFEIYLNKEFICCGYISSIPAEKKEAVLNAEIARFYDTTSNTIHFDAEI